MSENKIEYAFSTNLSVRIKYVLIVSAIVFGVCALRAYIGAKSTGLLDAKAVNVFKVLFAGGSISGILLIVSLLLIAGSLFGAISSNLCQHNYISLGKSWLDISGGRFVFGNITGQCPNSNCNGVVSVVKAGDNQQGYKYVGRCSKEKQLHTYTYERSSNCGSRVELLKPFKAAHR